MVPTFDKLMLPVLDLMKDGKERTNKNIASALAESLKFSEEDLSELIPCGVTRYSSNVNWAITFLYQAGLLTRIRIGHYTISNNGKKLLKEKPSSITEKMLKERYGKDSTFFNSNTSKAKESQIDQDVSSQKTPEEVIDENFSMINEALIDELLARVKEVHPKRFEQLVVELLVKMGYGGSIEDSGSVTQYSKDEGIDGVIKEDRLGLDTIYIQAKRWNEGTVGRKEIQSFVGALVGKHASKGIFITTSSFSKEAIEYAKNATTAKVILIDGNQLCKYMVECNMGVSTKQIYEIKRIDTDFFDED